MNNEFKIINYRPELTRSYIFEENKFEFSLNKISQIIKNILLKLKIIKECQSEFIEVKSKIIDTENIMEQIKNVINGVYIGYDKIDHIIIGRKQVEMLDDEYYKAQFTCNDRIYYGNGIQKIFGIQVIINPYIDGIVPVLKNTY